MTFLALVLHALSIAASSAGGREASSEPSEGAPALLVIEEAAEPEYNLELPLTFADGAVESRAVVRFDEQESGERLELTATRGEVTLSRVAGNQATPLTEPARFDVGEDGAALLTLRRRADRISALSGARSVLTVWEDATPGKLSLSAAEGLVNPDDIYYQPYAPPEFADDFMRGEKDSTGEWQVVSGSWENTALVDSLDFVPTAANSFAFAAHAAPTALAMVGPGFWDDLRCGVSVRLLESGRAGIGFRVQDEGSYYGFTLEFGSPEAPGRALLSLRKSVGGREEVLASTVRNVPIGQWYSLSVAAHEDRFEAFLDDVRVLEAVDPTYGQGSVALLAADCETAYFDDARAEEYKGFYDDFESNGRDRWQTIAGEWEVGPADGGTCLVKASKEASLAVVGRDEWTDYEYRVDLKPGRGGVGLCFYWLSPTDHWLWRWNHGTQQLVRVTEEGEKIVDEAPLELSQKAWARAVVRAGKDHATVTVNGGRPVEAIIPAGSSGRIGVWADRSTQAAFDNVKVRFPPGYVPSVLPETMVADAEMKEQFANPAEAWFSITDEAHRPSAVGMNWNKGEYFGPVDIVFPMSNVTAAAGKVTVTIEGDQTGTEGGYVLALSTEENSPKLAIELLREGERLTSANAEVDETGECQVRFGRRGTYVVVYVDDQLAISYREGSADIRSATEPEQPSGRVEPE